MTASYPYGPYHRLSNSRTQSDEDVRKQLASGEVWGAESRYDANSSVQAYMGALPNDETGIEFLTQIKHHKHNPMNDQVAWHEGAIGVSDKHYDQIANKFYVGIKVTITTYRMATTDVSK